MINQLVRLVPAFSRFLMVGLSGTLVNLGVLWLLAENIAMPRLIAVIIATEISIINNFVWNDCWTFKSNSDLPIITRFWRFQLITSLTAALTIGLSLFLNNTLQVHYLLAQAVAIGLATIINFGINTRVTWRMVE